MKKKKKFKKSSKKKKKKCAKRQDRACFLPFCSRHFPWFLAFNGPCRIRGTGNAIASFAA